MVAYSGDLWGSLTQIGITFGVLLLVGAIAFWRGRRRRSETLFLDVALSLGGWWVALSAISLIVILIKAFTVDWVEIEGPGLSIPLPADLPCLNAGEAQGPALTCSPASLPRISVYDVSTGIHALAAVGQACTLIVSTLPAALIAFICFQTLRGHPFHRTVIRALVIGAIVLLVAGVAGDLLNDITGTLALREVLPVGSKWYPESFMLSASGLPIGGAIALAALAAVFHQGFRLQSEHDRFQKDTEGLV